MFPHDMVLKQGSVWPEIRDLIKQHGIDLVVLGAHGAG
jgi:nucleotide-binding universal stress UspA family protein